MNTRPSPDITALLIDADNVSADVIEQAVTMLLKQHGALHVRRAWGTAESALKHQALFKRLGVRPMVNLASGKNATDIALAIDALDLALALRPTRVVIASSDSDFEPLVTRLRELGCEVLGIGQDGKTGAATRAVYDGYTVLTHRSATERRQAKDGPPDRAAAAPRPAQPAPSRTATEARPAPAARKTRRGGRGAGKATAPATPALLARPEKVQAVLQALPALAEGRTVTLRSAAEKLREAGVLGKRASSMRLFGQYPAHFELTPEDQPQQVRLKG